MVPLKPPKRSMAARNAVLSVMSTAVQPAVTSAACSALPSSSTWRSSREISATAYSARPNRRAIAAPRPVSYTHLTLPTICSV